MAWRLGIHHLWIDSLCIIQDDARDWKQESTKMNEIYENAFITIAATASSSCEEGIRFSRQPAECMDETQPFYVRRRADPESLLEEPLYQRGWTLQETVLSRRLVHFAKDQLYWSCRSVNHSEDEMYIVETSTLEELCSQPGVAAHNLWWSWLEDYSRRKLSMPQDKLPAIAGLTRKFQSLAKMTPAVGLWMEDIHHGLLWQPTKPAARTLTDIPSWSWASVDGPVRLLYHRAKGQPEDLHTQAVVKPQELTVRWEGEQFTSRISQASLRIKGRLKQANYTTTYSQMFSLDYGSTWRRDLEYLPHGQLFHEGSWTSPRVSYLFFDDGQGPSHNREIWCLQLSTNPPRGFTSQNTHNFLILQPTGGSRDEYRRIGVGCVEDEQPLFRDYDLFRDVEVQEVVLV